MVYSVENEMKIIMDRPTSAKKQSVNDVPCKIRR